MLNTEVTITMFDRDYDLFEFMQALLALLIVVAFIVGLLLDSTAVSELEPVMLIVVGFFFGKATATNKAQTTTPPASALRFFVSSRQGRQGSPRGSTTNARPLPS